MSKHHLHCLSGKAEYLDLPLIEHGIDLRHHRRSVRSPLRHLYPSLSSIAKSLSLDQRSHHGSYQIDGRFRDRLCDTPFIHPHDAWLEDLPRSFISAQFLCLCRQPLHFFDRIPITNITFRKAKMRFSILVIAAFAVSALAIPSPREPGHSLLNSSDGIVETEAHEAEQVVDLHSVYEARHKKVYEPPPCLHISPRQALFDCFWLRSVS